MAVGLPLPLIAGEKEKAVLPFHDLRDTNLFAKRTAVLVASQGIVWKQVVGIVFVEERIGIKIAIADIVKRAAVPFVRSGFHDFGDDAAAVAPVLRRVVVHKNAKFSDGVRIGVIHHSVAKVFVAQTSIQEIPCRVRAATGNAQRLIDLQDLVLEDDLAKILMLRSYFLGANR